MEVILAGSQWEFERITVKTRRQNFIVRDLSRLGSGERNLSRIAGQRPVRAERAGASESISQIFADLVSAPSAEDNPASLALDRFSLGLFTAGKTTGTTRDEEQCTGL
jgi:hypothetical protein